MSDGKKEFTPKSSPTHTRELKYNAWCPLSSPRLPSHPYSHCASPRLLSSLRLHDLLGSFIAQQINRPHPQSSDTQLASAESSDRHDRARDRTDHLLDLYGRDGFHVRFRGPVVWKVSFSVAGH
jgi:hypothetical protein